MLLFNCFSAVNANQDVVTTSSPVEENVPLTVTFEAELEPIGKNFNQFLKLQFQN